MPKSGKPQQKPPQTPAEPVAATPAHPAPAKPDWMAIERDYRTGRFSDQELADLHGNTVSRQGISVRAKRHGWTKDLSVLVRQETKASLLREQGRLAVATEVAIRCDETLKTVLAAAEVNKQVILGHRTDITRLRNITMGQVEALERQVAKAAVDQKPVDPAYVLLSVSRATQSLTRLHVAERKAYSLDEPDDPASAEVGKGPVLTVAQRAARLASLLEQAQKNKAAADAAAPAIAQPGAPDAAG